MSLSNTEIKNSIGAFFQAFIEYNKLRLSDFKYAVDYCATVEPLERKAYFVSIQNEQHNIIDEYGKNNSFINELKYDSDIDLYNFFIDKINAIDKIDRGTIFSGLLKSIYNSKLKEQNMASPINDKSALTINEIINYLENTSDYLSGISKTYKEKLMQLCPFPSKAEIAELETETIRARNELSRLGFDIADAKTFLSTFKQAVIAYAKNVVPIYIEFIKKELLDEIGKGIIEVLINMLVKKLKLPKETIKSLNRCKRMVDIYEFISANFEEIELVIDVVGGSIKLIDSIDEISTRYFNSIVAIHSPRYKLLTDSIQDTAQDYAKLYIAYSNAALFISNLIVTHKTEWSFNEKGTDSYIHSILMKEISMQPFMNNQNTKENYKNNGYKLMYTNPTSIVQKLSKISEREFIERSFITIADVLYKPHLKIDYRLNPEEMNNVFSSQNSEWRIYIEYFQKTFDKRGIEIW